MRWQTIQDVVNGTAVIIPWMWSTNNTSAYLICFCHFRHLQTVTFSKDFVTVFISWFYFAFSWWYMNMYLLSPCLLPHYPTWKHIVNSVYLTKQLCFCPLNQLYQHWPEADAFDAILLSPDYFVYSLMNYTSKIKVVTIKYILVWKDLQYAIIQSNFT